MDFAEDRKLSPGKMIGIGLVLLLHVVLIYVLVSGLASSAIDVIKKPLQIKIIQAQIAPPPPPPAQPLPPPKLQTPPPPYVPPPLIQTQTPPPPPVFAVTSAAKPAPVSTAPAPAAPAPRPAPSNVISIACPNVAAVAGSLSDRFQDIAENDGINAASVTVRFSISATGEVSGAQIVSSTTADVNQLALQGVQQLHCIGQGQAVQVEAPFTFQSN